MAALIFNLFKRRKRRKLADMLQSWLTEDDDPMDKNFLMQFFSYSHLPEHLQAISKPFGELAEKITELPANAERTTALRKLLEAKDCAVRALVAKE